MSLNLYVIISLLRSVRTAPDSGTINVSRRYIISVWLQAEEVLQSHLCGNRKQRRKSGGEGSDGLLGELGGLGGTAGANLPGAAQVNRIQVTPQSSLQPVSGTDEGPSSSRSDLRLHAAAPFGTAFLT